MWSDVGDVSDVGVRNPGGWAARAALAAYQAAGGWAARLALGAYQAAGG